MQAHAPPLLVALNPTVEPHLEHANLLALRHLHAHSGLQGLHAAAHGNHHVLRLRGW